MLDEDRNDDGGVWAGEQLLVVSGLEVLIGEDVIEGQSWTIVVVLPVTFGVVLLGCACAVFDPHLPTGNVHVTREQAIAKQRGCMSPRTMQDYDLDHVSERTWILSWFSRNQLWQLVLNENQTNVCCTSRVCCVGLSVGLQVAMTTCTNPNFNVLANGNAKL